MSVDKSLIAVWWLTQADYERNGGEVHFYSSQPEYWQKKFGTFDAQGKPLMSVGGVWFIDRSDLPDYIQQEVSSRCGRAGRGRLWIPEEIGYDIGDMEWDDTKPRAAEAGAPNCGGIVIWRKDIGIASKYGGFFTDYELNEIEANEAP